MAGQFCEQITIMVTLMGYAWESVRVGAICGVV